MYGIEAAQAQNSQSSGYAQALDVGYSQNQPVTISEYQRELQAAKQSMESLYEQMKRMSEKLKPVISKAAIAGAAKIGEMKELERANGQVQHSVNSEVGGELRFIAQRADGMRRELAELTSAICL